MKCRNPNCKKEVKFWTWLLIQRRCCVDCWMLGFEIPKINKVMENPKSKIKFEEWKKRKENKE